MKKVFSNYSFAEIFFLLLNATNLKSQNVGIGTPTPNSSARLDISATNKGVLVPQINLLGLTDAATVSAPASSLLIYNTNSTVGTGYYFNSGTPASPVWKKLLNTGDTGGGSGWLLTGNSGLGSDKFLGTIDTSSLRFRVGNISAGIITDYNYANTALGSYALLSITPDGEYGVFNTAFGFDALGATTTGIENTAVGYGALNHNTFGNNSTAVGSFALSHNITGHENVALGFSSLVPNETGSYNTAVGTFAGTILTNLNNTSAIGYETRVNASNNMVFGNGSVIGWGFGTFPDSAAIKVGSNSTNGNGASLTVGGVWTNASDKNLKDDITVLDRTDILNRISKLNITKWRYKGTTNEYHIGPIAQDFYTQFKLGVDDKSISTIDPSGIALVGIQALIKENKELQSTIQELQKRVNILENKQ